MSQTKDTGNSFISFWKIWSNISFWLTVKWFFQSPIVPIYYKKETKRREENISAFLRDKRDSRFPLLCIHKHGIYWRMNETVKLGPALLFGSSFKAKYKCEACKPGIRWSHSSVACTTNTQSPQHSVYSTLLVTLWLQGEKNWVTIKRLKIHIYTSSEIGLGTFLSI